MDQATQYIDINKALWNERTKHHVASGFYDMDGFNNGATSLREIELDLLGNITGKDVLHLQCHFGQDTLSLARMGANVTGLDFSDEAIKAAQNIAADLNIAANFICSDVYYADQVVAHKSDLVFTTYGVLGWLPDLKKWANVVAACLKPGGELLLVEFHPYVWMYDNNLQHIAYSYFNKEAIVEVEQGTYADTSAPIALTSVGWNHPLADVVSALIGSGMRITVFQEYDYSPYSIFADNVEVAPGRFQLKGMEGKFPLVYAIKAVKE